MPTPMNRHLHIIALVVVLLNPPAAVASQEGVLRLSTFNLSSPGIGQSGPVVISGEQDKNQFISLTVRAFGRTASLSKDQLAKLRGGFINGLQISYEAGYRELGGRTIYIVLSEGFTSGLQETQLIIINEQGVVEVNNVIRHVP